MFRVMLIGVKGLVFTFCCFTREGYTYEFKLDNKFFNSFGNKRVFFNTYWWSIGLRFFWLKLYLCS